MTDEKMKTVENCCRMVLQKIAKVRIADTTLRSVADNTKSYSSAYIRDAEKTARFEDGELTRAIDELKDELGLLPSVNGQAPATTTTPAIA